MPIVSVVMITYNHENYIKEAIEGVLMQESNYQIELIIANDASSDTTDSVIESIIKNHPRGSWISSIKHENNIGMMPNFIFALEQCSGKYIALCEGDDYWTDPLKLQKQVGYLESNAEYVLCFHPVDILKMDGSVVDDFITSLPENYQSIETLARLGNFIHTPSVVFRNVLEEIPMEFYRSPIGDYFLYMMLLEHGELKYISDKMAVYRYGVGVFSGTTHSRRLQKELIMLAGLLSYLKNENYKEILLNRYVLLVDEFQSSIESDCKIKTPPKPFFNRVINDIKRNYKHPNKILKKVYFKLSKQKY